MPITVNINAGQDAASSSVAVTGSVQHIITNDERTAFGIQDAALKAAIGAYFGKAPDDAFLCSPTPWGDLYNRYGWPQVQTILTVQSATIIGIQSEPTILNSQEFKNNSSVAANFNCGVTQEVSVTAESNWTNTQSIDVSQSVSYGISFLGSGAEGETTFSFSQSWEQGGSNSETVTLGSSSGVEVTLQPGQSVTAELSAGKGSLQVQIVYQVTLIGDTAINYGDPYQGHHFWALDVNAVMAYGNIPTTLTMTEVITIDYYSNSKIVVNDSTGQQLVSTMLAARAGVEA